MKSSKKSLILIIIFLIVILIPIIILGNMNYKKEFELNNKIENSKKTRILSINDISTPITIENLKELELSEEYTIYENISVYNQQITVITYTNTSFCGAFCEKDYFFYDNQLKRCNFNIDNKQWMPKNIYEEIVKINGEPDISEISNEGFDLEIHTWYGKNGTIIYTKRNSDTIEIDFELSE